MYCVWRKNSENKAKNGPQRQRERFRKFRQKCRGHEEQIVPTNYIER